MNESAVVAAQKLTGGEAFWYYLWNIVTLGFPYLMKIMIKRAVLEALAAQQLGTHQSPPPPPPGPVPAR